MALRAKKPELKDNPRLKVVLYSDQKVGKSHFCCSIPDTYYIDTEKLDDFPHLMKKLRDNGGDYVYLPEISDIIQEVKSLMLEKHTYKTVVIDSLSMACASLNASEAERLANPKKGVEGTEFGMNKSKSARLTHQLSVLLTRLDMNVIVTSHSKDKYVDDKHVGKTFDIPDKMAYSLGAYCQMRRQGTSVKLLVEGSRYPEVESGSLLDFNNGYDVIKGIFGEEIFIREVAREELASVGQIETLNRLVGALDIQPEVTQKWLTKAQSTSFEEMSSKNIQACISFLEEKINTKPNVLKIA